MSTAYKTRETPAPLIRRLAAILYDAFLIAALLIAVATPPVLLNGGPIRDGSTAGEIKNIFFLVYLSCWVFLFYGWFWTHGGQTLGMNAWKIRIIGQNGAPITWQQAFIRLLSACLGLANLSSPFNQQRQGWHERLSRTKTVRVDAA
jgi:uncharacterized RDD family membrane protein YckC